MRKTITRSALAATAAAATTAGLLGLFSGPASAAPGDPVTGGTTTIATPVKTVLAEAAAGIYFIPQTPAGVGYDSANQAVDLMLPVNGGDGSVNSDYGSVVHGGALKVSDYKTHRSVTLTNITFALDTLQVSATPSTGGDAVVIADLAGSNTFSSDSTTGRQEFTSTDLQIDAAGATYLDKALCTKAFKAGQSLGSFDTVFTNTQY